MTIDTTELKKAAESCDVSKCADEVEWDRRFSEFLSECDPDVTLALLAEIDRLEDGEQVADELCAQLSGLLEQIATILRGPAAPKQRHGFADLPSRVKAVVAERDQLAADNESLRGSCKAMGVDMGKLTRERNSFRRGAEKLEAENEALRTQAQDAIAGQMHLINERDLLMLDVEELRKDAERYRWIRTADWWRSPMCAISNPKEQAKLGSDCPSGDRLDAQIDAAMAKEASHG